MLRIRLTINFCWYHNIHTSSPSQNHSIRWNAAPGRDKTSGVWSDHWQWIALQLLSTPKMTGKLWQKQPLMKWWWELCGYYINSLYLFCQHHGSVLSLTVLDHARKQAWKNNGAVAEKKMSKTAKPKVDEKLAIKSHQFWVLKFHTSGVAMEAQVYGLEKVTTEKRRQIQIRQNTAWHAGMQWSDADRQSAKELLECEVFHVTPVKW